MYEVFIVVLSVDALAHALWYVKVQKTQDETPQIYPRL